MATHNFLFSSPHLVFFFFRRTFFRLVRLCVGGASCQLQDSYGGSAGNSPSGSSPPSLASKGRESAAPAGSARMRARPRALRVRSSGERSRRLLRPTPTGPDPGRERELACGAARLLGDQASADLDAKHHQTASRLPAWLELGVGAELARFGLLQGQCWSRLSPRAREFISLDGADQRRVDTSVHSAVPVFMPKVQATAYGM